MKTRFIQPGKALWHLPVLFCALLTLVLIVIPTGFEDALQFRDAERCRARVIEVYDNRIVDTGIIRSGEQICLIEFEDGKFKGLRTEGYNLLNGSLESDKIFTPGDTIQTVVHYREPGPQTADAVDGELVSDVKGNDYELLSVTLIDHYRLNGELVLAAVFVLFLVAFAGQTGIRAVLSFIITVLAIWKLLVPLYLKGWNPVWTGLAISLLLTICIISLVYGFDRRFLAAAGGSFLGIGVACILGIICTNAFKIHGAVMSYSESLLYSGFQDLNLTQIFMASIFIGASGAMMDLAVDITSAVHEIVGKKPDIGWREACVSGMNVARAAMGTMTTTLLLAYSGGFIALLMVFMAQGTPVYNILNYRYVASEILDTIAGSFGLVTVGPFAAITSALLLTRGRKTIRTKTARTEIGQGT